jgi:hypothetical protein
MCTIFISLQLSHDSIHIDKLKWLNPFLLHALNKAKIKFSLFKSLLEPKNVKNFLAAGGPPGGWWRRRLSGDNISMHRQHPKTDIDLGQSLALASFLDWILIGSVSNNLSRDSYLWISSGYWYPGIPR